jgi:GT2 family glycosyltransferase
MILSACAGASLYRRALLADIGLFDERFFAYYEDTDLSLRARLAGWQVRYVGAAVVRHDLSATSRAIAGFSRYHCTRNLWWLHLKNLPPSLLIRLAPRLVRLQARWLLEAAREREARVVVRAHRDAMRGLPAALRARRHIQRNRRISAADATRTFLASPAP